MPNTRNFLNYSGERLLLCPEWNEICLGASIVHLTDRPLGRLGRVCNHVIGYFLTDQSFFHQCGKGAVLTFFQTFL